MHLAEIWRYPVKSMAGERLESAELGPLGVPGDRQLFVVDAEGQVQTARTRRTLLLHRGTWRPGEEVQVDGRTWDAPEVAADVARAAGAGARLVRARGAERFDALPLLVGSDGAIAALGVDHRRLRPNLVIGEVEGLDERTWPGRFLQVGGAVVALARMRGRCVMTTYDPDTAVQDPQVLKRIVREFGGSFFLDAWVARSGAISVGDPVSLLDTFESPEPPLFGRFA